MFSLHRTAVAGYPQAGFASFLCYDLEAIGGFVTQRVWSPIIWAGGSRGEAFFRCACWCVLDFDETMTKEEARKVFAGYAHFLAPTNNDGKPKVSSAGRVRPAHDRFRVALRFSEAIWDADVFRYNMRRVIKQYNADPLAFDAGRVWQPSTSVEYISLNGETIDVDPNVPVEETQSYRQEHFKAITKARSRVWPDVVKRFVDGEIRPAERNDMLFKSACFFFEIGWTVEKFRALAHSIKSLDGHDKTETTIKSAARRTGAAYF